MNSWSCVQTLPFIQERVCPCG